MRRAHITIEEYFGGGTGKQALFDWKFRCELFHKQHGICYWCFEQMSLNHVYVNCNGKLKFNPKFATFEHLIPRSLKGPRRSKKNIVLAHGNCNHNRIKRCWPHDPIYGSKVKFICLPMPQTKRLDIFPEL